jgi:site-specific recombinase XerC
VKDFMRFAGIRCPEEFRSVTRAHLIAWRDELRRRGLGGATIRHRLASLASLFEHLCEKNAVTHNPVKGVERPNVKVAGKGGKTRYLTLHPGTNGLINDHLDAAGHGLDESGALFRSVRNNPTGRLEDAITADGLYRLVRRYFGRVGVF